ncbi:MAG: DUF1013 domain-containing protein [Rhodobacteraceae bacterium]|nr:DUF1013 domain-containing protein [Paracoccaceae bacterium]
MPKATAVWLVDNTTLTFDQIADFTGMHPLEISGIADGEVAVGIKGFDPVANNQLTRAELDRCEKDSTAKLQLLKPISTPQPKKKAPRYTPLSKRQDRPSAINWLVRNHPELADPQICKLLGTTKTTIAAIRDKTHWNSSQIDPVDPVALGLCTQIALDAAVKVAAERKAKEDEAAGIVPPTEEERLMSTEESLSMDPREAMGGAMSENDPLFVPSEKPEPSPFDDLSNVFDSPSTPAEEQPESPAELDPDAFFNLPSEKEDKRKDGED